MEAVNSIILLVDISNSSVRCLQMKVFQEVLEAIVGMIRDVGSKNCVKTTILENHSVDNVWDVSYYGVVTRSFVADEEVTLSVFKQIMERRRWMAL